MSNLKDFLDEANDAFGDNTVLFLNDPKVSDVKVISTGIKSVDSAIGVGGVPMGKITEIFGANSSGKTTLCLNMIATANRAGVKCLIIDAEHALNIDWAKKIGVNPELTAISQPMSGDEALQLVELACASNQFGLIVVDSVAALTPQSESDKVIGELGIGLLARLMSQALRKLVPQISKSGSAVVFINQIRSNIGQFGFGDKNTTPGGNALKFASSLRIKMSMVGGIVSSKGGVKGKIGSKHRAEIVKNKLAVPFKQAEFEIRENGISEKQTVE